MIVTLAELKLFVNWLTPSKEELAVLSSIHASAESEVKKYLGYDPEQRERTEYYPRHIAAGGPGIPNAVWETNAAGSRAVRSSVASLGRSLQLSHIPVRSVTEVRVDLQGKHGGPATAFGDDTVWTENVDYWLEIEEAELCMGGMLLSNRGWPIEPGTVKVTYRAGFSPDEFNGKATASGTVNSRR